MNTYDPILHRYEIDGVEVPSTTKIIRSVLGGWQADQWAMDRGTVVHECARLIALGKEFTNDPAVDGYVAAIRRWFARFKPVVTSIEESIFNERYRYGG